jgi:hypothetical protein
MRRIALGVVITIWCCRAPAQTVNVTTTPSEAAPGYLPVFQPASAGEPTSMVFNSMVIQKGLSTGGTGIGIGTQVPAATLDVNGSTNVEGTLTLTPFVTATSGNAGGPSNQLYFIASAWNTSTNSAENEAYSLQAEPVCGNFPPAECAPPGSMLSLLTGLPGSRTNTLLNISNTGAIAAWGPVSAAGLSATINVVGSSAVIGNNTATSGSGTNGGYFSSLSPQGTAVVGVNTSGGSAGYFQGPVTVQGAVTGLSVSATNNVVGSSAVIGNNTATSGSGTNGGYFSSLSPQGAAVVGVNTSGGSAGYFQGPVTVQGAVTTGAITITGGSDLAEPFPISGARIPLGAVVVIDEDRPGQLKVSEHAYDTHVAGIVSGANGVQPGISMGQKGILDSGQNVALGGRVYALVDASNGTIKPGDLLTTSDTPGYAMKVTDHARAQGALLGKAMTALSEGKGMVLVLVALH